MAAPAFSRSNPARRYQMDARAQNPRDPRFQQQDAPLPPQGPQGPQDPGQPPQPQFQSQPPGAPGQDPRTFQPVNVPQGPQNPVGYNDTRDVYDMFQNNRGLSQGQGDAFNQQFKDQGNYDQSMGRGYDNLVPGLYGDIWQGKGGYNPQQQDEIRQSQGLANLAWNPQSAQDNYLNPTEQRQIAGDPYGAFNLWKGSAPGLESTANDAATMQRAGVNDMTQRYDQSLGRTSNEQGDILGDSSARLRSIAGNKALNVDPEYTRQAGMTDGEVQDTSNMGAQTAGAGWQRQMDDLSSSLHAAGVTNPMGESAAKQDMLAHQGADVTDAAVRSRLAARAAQRDAAQNVENTRLGAERYKTGLQSDTENNIMGTGLGVSRDIAGRAEGGASNIGSLGTNVEGQIGNRDVGVREYNTGLGTSLYGQGENTASGRAQSTAANRQNVNLTNQENQFNRGYTLNNTASQRGTTIANQNQQQSAEGRAAAMGQQGFFGQQGNTAAGNQLKSWGQQQEGTDAASRGYAGWGNEQDQNGFGSNFARGFGNAFGGGLGKDLTSGGHADGGDFDPFGENDADRDDRDGGMTVLSPEGSYGIPKDTTVLPTNPNRETSPDGRPNRFYQMGKDLLPKFRDMAYGPAERAKQVGRTLGDVKNLMTGGGFNPDSYSNGGYMGPKSTYGSGGGGYAGGGVIGGGGHSFVPDVPNFHSFPHGQVPGAHLQSTPAAVVQGNHISSVSEEGPEILLSRRNSNARHYQRGMRPPSHG